MVSYAQDIHNLGKEIDKNVICHPHHERHKVGVLGAWWGDLKQTVQGCVCVWCVRARVLLRAVSGNGGGLLETASPELIVKDVRPAQRPQPAFKEPRRDDLQGEMGMRGVWNERRRSLESGVLRPDYEHNCSGHDLSRRRGIWKAEGVYSKQTHFGVIIHLLMPCLLSPLSQTLSHCFCPPGCLP